MDRELRDAAEQFGRDMVAENVAGLAQAMMRRASGESTRLSDREHHVLVLLADGLSAAEIEHARALVGLQGMTS